MMTEGIIVFNHEEQEWRFWIGQKDYWLQQGYSFELLMIRQYYRVFLEKDMDWFVTLEDGTRIVLHIHAVYKVRGKIEEFMRVADPF